jgi:UDP-2,3-diacylglucosamine pyrophosphatase LpxH
MKQKRFLLNSVLILSNALLLGACGQESVQPLWNEGKVEGTKTSVIISDLHLGVDSAFAENVKNVPYLVSFLNRAAVTENLDEVVLAGDLLDGWFLPFSYGPIQDYLSFYKKVASANQSFIDAVNAIIKKGRIKVVYVPGNHDVDFSKDIAEAIFPGISQARDSEGVGTYYTGVRNEVAIEHGHRYNVFCAPDSMTDVSLRQGKTLIGPGYFYTRLAATSLTTGHNARAFDFPDFNMPSPASDSVENAYKLYLVWKKASASIGVPGMTFTSKSIPCGIAGYEDYYALSDLVPLYRDGALTKTLFMGIDANWAALQTLNKVKAIQEFGPAVLEAADLSATDAKAYADHFNVDKNVDVVVLGHTHAPMIVKNKTGYAGKIYANSGTWIDANHDSEKPNRNFVKIVSSSSKDEVGLYSFGENGSISEITE